MTNFLYATNFPIDSLANSLVSLNLSINAAPAKFLIIVYKIDDFGYFAPGGPSIILTLR